MDCDKQDELVKPPTQAEKPQTVISNARAQSISDCKNQTNKVAEKVEHSLRQLNQTNKVAEKVERSLCQLNKIDSAASIKHEVQQLLRLKVSEEISSKVLNDMKVRAREHMSDLQMQNDNLKNSMQALNKVVADDEKKLAQFESALLQTNEVIGFLKTSMDKLSLKYQNVCKNDLSEKALKQKEELVHLKRSKSSILGKEKEEFQNVETSCHERVQFFKCDLLQKRDFLKKTIEKYEDFRKVVTAFEQDISKNRLKKQKLEQKLKAVSNRSSNDYLSLEQSEELKRMDFTVQQLEEKFKSLSDKKCCIEQDFQQLEPELKELQVSLSSKEEKISEQQQKLSNLQEELKNIREQNQESLKVKIQKFDESCNNICETMECFAQYFFKNNALFLETSNTSLLHMNQKSLFALKKYLERQQTINRFQIKHETNQSETNEQLLQSLKDDAVIEKEQFMKEFTELKLKVEVLEKEQESYFSEAEKKKEYLLANATFLEQKQESLAQEILEYEKSNEKLLSENLVLMESINLKKQQLKEHNYKLNVLAQPPSNPKPTTERKVTFNDYLSFKSPTSSELSNCGPGDQADLNTSNYSSSSWRQNGIVQKASEIISDEDF